MQQADANGDGQIDEAEAEQFARNRSAQLRKQLDTVVKRFDANGDGALDDDETAKMKNQIAERGGKDPVPGLRMIDKDGDFKISDEEEAAAVKAFVAQARKGGKAPAAKQRRPDGHRPQADPDANSDGIVDEQEARAAAERRLEMIRKQLEAFAERKARDPNAKLPPFMAMFDPNGDGELSGEEANTIVEQQMGEFEVRNALVLKIFDDNKNGVLDDMELVMAKKAFAYAEETRKAMGERMRKQNQGAGDKPARPQGGPRGNRPPKAKE